MNTSAFRTLLLSLFAVAALCVGNAAFAHARLVSSTPAADSHVAEAAQIDLVFNETLVARASKIVLNRVEGGKAVPVEHVEVTLLDDGKTLRAKPMHALEPGHYRVEWRVVGKDNHAISGDFGFMIH